MWCFLNATNPIRAGCFNGNPLPGEFQKDEAAEIQIIASAQANQFAVCAISGQFSTRLSFDFMPVPSK
jgi:hypothetical protein